MEETFLNTVKAIYNKPTASITLKREKLESFPPRSATKNHYSLSSLPLRKFRKSHPALLGGKKRGTNWKQRSHIIPVAGGRMLRIEKSKDYMYRLLEL